MLLTIVGIILLISVAVTNLPQVYQMLKTKNTSGVSLTMHAAFAVSWSMWLVYAIHVNDGILIASNALGAVVEFFVTFLLIFYRIAHHENVLGAIKNEGHNLWVIVALLFVGGSGFFSLDLMVILLAIIDTTIIIPQVIEVYKVEDLSGASMLSWWLFVGEAILCIYYAIGIGEPLSYAWAYLFLPCYFVIIYKLWQYRVKARKVVE